MGHFLFMDIFKDLTRKRFFPNAPVTHVYNHGQSPHIIFLPLITKTILEFCK